MSNYKDKLDYFNIVMLPDLEEAFKRGDEKYVGNFSDNAKHIFNREVDEDIRHVRELHVDVRLREAEELADNFDFDGALDKIVSAVGYLVILHKRINAGLYGD